MADFEVFYGMKIMATIWFVFVWALSPAQNPWKNVYTHEAWAQRDAWQKPEALIDLLKIKPGSAVADIGCHEGYMTFKLARKVGSKGSVYAVDIDQSKLDKVKQRADDNSLHQIHVVKGSEKDPELPENSLDAVLILDTYHEMEDHAEILQHINAALRKGGRLLLCEPIADERKDLTRGEQEGKHELGLQFALDDLKEAGFKVIFQKENFIDRTKEKGDRMWVLVGLKI